MSPNPPSPEDALCAVNAWNATYPVGTYVEVRLDDGSIRKTFTIERASVLGGHTAVAWLHGFFGCYRLDRCTVIPNPNAEVKAAYPNGRYPR